MAVKKIYYIIVRQEDRISIQYEEDNLLNAVRDLKWLNSEIVKDLLKKGMTEENVGEALDENARNTSLAYYVGKGYDVDGELDIYVQIKKIRYLSEEEQKERENEKLNCEG